MASYGSDDEEEINYSTDPVWADVTPLPQDDGPSPLAQIASKPASSTTRALSPLCASMMKLSSGPWISCLSLVALVGEADPLVPGAWPAPFDSAGRGAGGLAGRLHRSRSDSTWSSSRAALLPRSWPRGPGNPRASG